jgi:hypothetical protein
VSPGRFPLLAALALSGVAIAGYLALFQLGVVATAWDPVFGDGTARVLTSMPAGALPVPDALLGAVVYGLEVVLLVGARVAAPGTRSVLIVLLGALAAVMALAGLVLVALQALVIGAWCLLCLASAGISWAIALVAVPEAVSAIRARRAAVPDDAPRDAAPRAASNQMHR